MRDIFTSFDEDSNDKKLSGEKISFDDYVPESEVKFEKKIDSFTDFDSGRNDFYDSIFENEKTVPIKNEPVFINNRINQNRNYSSPVVNKQPEYDNEPYFPAVNSVPDYELPHDSTDDEKTGRATHKTKKKKKSGKKIAVSVLCILLVLIIGAGGYAYSLCSKINYQPDTHKANEFISDNELMSDKRVYNILIIGTDKRASQSTYRSDTMMLLSLDKKTKKVKMTSFLRDSYVYIPAKGISTKLNAACSYGGPQMVMDTIEYNFKVHIDKYVMIDFDIFKTIIHDLGGVTLTMTEEEAACIRRESGYSCKAGTHTYKAKIALWYARIRHIDSDFKRTERQRKVINAVIDKMKHSDPKTLITMFNEVLPLVQSDLNSAELMKAGISSLGLINNATEEMQIPAKGTWSNATINGQAVLKMDIDKNAQLLKEFIYG